MKTLKIRHYLTACFFLAAALSLQSCPDTAAAREHTADGYTVYTAREARQLADTLEAWEADPMGGVVYEPLGK
ncbi:hypothetical protein [Neisseria animalis]|uniref:Uncharacterized protein n=1 Tax=Neisseria animalis TaxID=492 RepID=A0A5P3MQG1_NEIAN|nr:hypothetical protein [Neisseria animalis]QEY23816.1 hypothetical protein D0T90_04275 [Neisseria animalis]ROW31595.1 hypothetical protein CGZ60_09475 [Neisseria animalis]VEE09784.1 Uncharacterised protein [Neisseria animalis]